MKKFKVIDIESSGVFLATPEDACKAMTRLEKVRKQRAFLIERLGVFRVACVTLRVRKQRTEAELVRLRAELEAERAESDKWRKFAERCFDTALRNAVLLADERNARACQKDCKRGE